MSFWYLATPYSAYASGTHAAFVLAAQQAALLMKAGVTVFSPITHSHPIALYGHLDPLDHTLWMPFDTPMMQAAKGLIMLRAAGWRDSYGMRMELAMFEAAGKPVVYMDPDHIPQEFRK